MDTESASLLPTGAVISLKPPIELLLSKKRAVSPVGKIPARKRSRQSASSESRTTTPEFVFEESHDSDSSLTSLSDLECECESDLTELSSSDGEDEEDQHEDSFGVVAASLIPTTPSRRTSAKARASPESPSASIPLFERAQYINRPVAALSDGRITCISSKALVDANLAHYESRS